MHDLLLYNTQQTDHRLYSPVFEWLGCVITILILKYLKSGPVFRWIRYSGGRYSDGYCIQMVKKRSDATSPVFRSPTVWEWRVLINNDAHSYKQYLFATVICCCKLKNTRDCDKHLLGQVSTCTGHYQLPIFRCTIVHLWRWACLHFRRAVYRWHHEL